MTGWLLLPFITQAVVMLVDEFKLHRRRGLPKWERLGHPIDTSSVLACYVFCLNFRPSEAHLTVYVALSVFSSLLITKDEFVHAQQSVRPLEHWLHALLFVLHPIVLMAAGVLWWRGTLQPLWGQSILTLAFLLYQYFYWNAPWIRVSRSSSTTNSMTRSVSAGTRLTTTQWHCCAPSLDSEIPGSRRAC